MTPTIPTAHDRNLEDVLYQIKKIASAIYEAQRQFDREKLAKLRKEYTRLCAKRINLWRARNESMQIL